MYCAKCGKPLENILYHDIETYELAAMRQRRKRQHPGRVRSYSAVRNDVLKDCSIKMRNKH